MAFTGRAPMSVPMFHAVFSLISLLGCYGGAQRLFAAEAQFASFTVKIDIDIEDGEIDMLATFSLGAGANKLDFAKEVISLQVTGGAGAYSVTIPAGSFKPDRSGEYKFQGSINRVKLEATLRPARAGAFEFEIETEGANLRGFSNPVTVRLAGGDNGGSRVVRAEIE